jgi:type IV pilus assembly protein PilE
MTLMELLAVVAVVAIISAIAIPSYRAYVMRAHRTEAKSALLAMAAQLERCFTRYNAYDHDLCTVDITNVPTEEGNYSLTAVRDSTTFTITAAPDPQSGQAEDKCGSFTFDSSNTKDTVGGSLPAADCWAR